MTHWLTRYDPDDGEPYGTVCDCGIDADHDGTGALNGPTDEEVNPMGRDENDPRDGQTSEEWKQEVRDRTGTKK